MRLMPLARTEELVVQQANEETLVYDQKNHQAHCLGKLASLVWRHCDGRTSPQAVAERIHRQCTIPADADLVGLAVQELAKANLLQDQTLDREGRRKYSRRELAARLGSGTAAFIMAPLVTSLMTRSAMAQASPSPTTTPGPTTTTTTTLPIQHNETLVRHVTAKVRRRARSTRRDPRA